MAPRLSSYLRKRMRQQRLPEFVVLQVFDEPDGVERNAPGAWPDREIRWRAVEIEREARRLGLTISVPATVA